MNIKSLQNRWLFSGLFCLYFSGLNAVTLGEELYMKNCMVCHADDGSGAMPGVVDLDENKAWSTIDEKILINRLKQGIQKPGAAISMPAKGGNPDLT